MKTKFSHEIPEDSRTKKKSTREALTHVQQWAV